MSIQALQTQESQWREIPRPSLGHESTSLTIKTPMKVPYQFYYDVGGQFIGMLFVICRSAAGLAMDIQTELCFCREMGAVVEYKIVGKDEQNWLTLRKISAPEVIDTLTVLLQNQTPLSKNSRLFELMNETGTGRQRSMRYPKMRKSYADIELMPMISLEDNCGTIPSEIGEDPHNFHFTEKETFVPLLVRIAASSWKNENLQFCLKMTPVGATNSVFSRGITVLSKIKLRVSEGGGAGTISNNEREKYLEKLLAVRSFYPPVQDPGSMLLDEVIEDMIAKGALKKKSQKRTNDEVAPDEITPKNSVNKKQKKTKKN
jgi:hypothetical protein